MMWSWTKREEEVVEYNCWWKTKSYSPDTSTRSDPSNSRICMRTSAGDDGMSPRSTRAPTRCRTASAVGSLLRIRTILRVNSSWLFRRPGVAARAPPVPRRSWEAFLHNLLMGCRVRRLIYRLRSTKDRSAHSSTWFAAPLLRFICRLEATPYSLRSQ